MRPLHFPALAREGGFAFCKVAEMCLVILTGAVDRLLGSVTSGGSTLAVSSVQSDNDGYGLPNVIQWKTAGLQAGVTYTVRITGVIGAPQSSYEYTFRLVS